MKLNKVNLEYARCFYLFLVVIIVISLISVFIFNTALAKAPTNINKVTDLFPKEIEDKQKLESFLENSKNQAESGIGSKAGLKELGANENELENKTSELQSINANSLESKGQQERAKKEHSYYDSLEVDYNDPKIFNHKKDVDLIANANEKLMSRLIEGLRELDIDCKQVKGNVEVEPEYYLEIEKEHLEDTIYNQHICEESRNKYLCRGSVNLSCKTKADKVITIKNISVNQQETGAANMDGAYNQHSISSRPDPVAYNGEWEDLVVSSSVTTVCPTDGWSVMGACIGDRGWTVTVNVGFDLGDFSAGSKLLWISSNIVGLKAVTLNGQAVWAVQDNNDWIKTLLARTVSSQPITSDISFAAHAGYNSLAITYYAVTDAGGTARFRATELACIEWNEEWEEQCTLEH